MARVSSQPGVQASAGATRTLFETLPPMNSSRQRLPGSGGYLSQADCRCGFPILRRWATAGVALVCVATVLTAWESQAARAEDAEEPQATRASCALRICCFNVENLAAPGERTNLTRFRFDPARRRHLEQVEALVSLLHEKGLHEFRGYHVDGRDSFSGFDVAIISRIEPDDVEGGRIHIYVPAKKKKSATKSAGNASDSALGPTAGEEGDEWLRQAYSHPDAHGGTRHEEALLQRHAVAYFTVCGRRIGLLGMHLKSNPSDVGSNAQRTAETVIAREILRRKIVARGYLPIVLGDLNDYDPDVPMADTQRRTRTTVLQDLKNYDDSSDGDELVNAAKFIPRIADRYTSHWDFNENGAADRDDVFSMIDHVLVHRDLVPALTRVFICHAIDLDVSDHFPVVVDFDLTKLKAE